MKSAQGTAGRRGKRQRAPPPQAEHAATPPSAGCPQPQKQRERDRQPWPELKRRKCGAELDSGSATSNFLDKMRARLSGGHFRMLNEKLYTCRQHEALYFFIFLINLIPATATGAEAFVFFKENPELFDVYHSGYQQQMSRWPEQPVNIIIKWLQSHSPALIIADFGCGDASLAGSVKNKVYSMDLVASNPSVIACDMANTPLDSLSVDVAVFCLSLMGINFPNYLVEASRVLRPNGWLLVAEVRSRFDPKNGGADPEKFCKAVDRLGFSLVYKDFSNRMFILLYFRKNKQTSKVKEIQWPELKPCLYKRR